jgi:hypothetical protein
MRCGENPRAGTVVPGCDVEFEHGWIIQDD